MRIICDMDEVIVDMMNPLIEKYNKKYSSDLTIDDLTQWQLPEDMKNIYMEKHFFYTLSEVDGSIKGIEQLMKWGHEVIIATNHSGEGSIARDKIDWIGVLLPQLKANMMIGHRKDILQGDIIIDDNADYLINSPCPIKICMDRPWNRDFSLYNGKVSYRVYHWGQILELFQPGGDSRLW